MRSAMSFSSPLNSSTPLTILHPLYLPKTLPQPLFPLLPPIRKWPPRRFPKSHDQLPYPRPPRQQAADQHFQGAQIPPVPLRRNQLRDPPRAFRGEIFYPAQPGFEARPAGDSAIHSVFSKNPAQVGVDKFPV